MSDFDLASTLVNAFDEEETKVPEAKARVILQTGTTYTRVARPRLMCIGGYDE
jgi:hypothetical protein